MSIENMTAKAGPFDCDGVQTAFPFAFDPLDSSYLTVYVNSDIVSSGYTTTLNASGGTVTFATPPASGARVAILRNVPPTQLVDLQNNTAFLPEVIEGMGDKLTAIAQQLQEVEERAFVVPPTASGTAKDAIEDMISSGGGGGGGGGSSYEFSNEFNVTSGGSVSINSISGSKISGKVGTASVASALTSDAKSDIVSSAGGKYTGPFAIEPDEDNDGRYKVREGIVYAGGTKYQIGESGNLSLSSASIYLVLSSGGGSVTSSYVSSYPGSTNPDMLVTRIGGVYGGAVTQYQFGDITCVPWGASAGGAGVVAYPNYNSGTGLNVSTYYTTSGGSKTGYTNMSSQGGLILGTIQATSASAVGAYIQLMAGANERLEQTYLQTVFNPEPSGTSEILLCIPIGPDTDFIITYDNCMVSTDYSDSPGVHISTLSFYPYIIKS